VATVERLDVLRAHGPTERVCRHLAQSGQVEPSPVCPLLGGLCCKSPKLPCDKFHATRRTNRRPAICVASIALPTSPVNSSSDDEVPHIFTRKSRLQAGEFLITSSKRLLQHNRHQADLAAWLPDVRFQWQEQKSYARRAFPVMTPGPDSDWVGRLFSQCCRAPDAKTTPWHGLRSVIRRHLTAGRRGFADTGAPGARPAREDFEPRGLRGRRGGGWTTAAAAQAERTLEARGGSAAIKKSN